MTYVVAFAVAALVCWWAFETARTLRRRRQEPPRPGYIIEPGDSRDVRLEEWQWPDR